MDTLKTIAGILVLILVANIILFALSKISALIFWAMIFFIGLIAYKGMDFMKKVF